MKFKKYLLSILVLAFFSILFLTTKSYAGELELKNLDFDVKLNSDGTAYITETWDIDIEETNTLFKTFKLDSSKFGGYKDASVIEVTDGKTKEFEQIYEEQYHVKKDCFYALKNKKGDYEIAWGVHEDNSSARRQFKISYTAIDAVRNYSDCSEFYCQLIGNAFEIPAKNVTGTIKLQNPVENMDDLRAWAHGPLEGNIERVSKDTIKFNVPQLKAKTMLEVRIMAPTYVFEKNANKFSTSHSELIFEEEQAWADKANEERQQAELIWYGMVAVAVLITSLFIGLCIKYIIDGKKLKEKYPTKKFDFEYFRDIPDEQNATPARAAYLYYFNKNVSTINANLPKVFSATMLDFALKGIISFEPINDKEFNIIIDREKANGLSDDEEPVFRMISGAAKDSDRITTKELLKYSKKEYNKVYPLLSKIPDKVESYHKQAAKLDEEKKKASNKWKNKGALYITLIFVIIFFLVAFVPLSLVAVIPLAICAGICYSNASKISILTDKGEEEKAMWKGLKKYMEEFSLLKEKDVPDLVLWEKYLIYATAFGISKKVISELKVVYKELSDPNYLTTHNYTYMYYMTDSRFGNDFISSFDKTMNSVYNSVSSAYSAAHSSSSSGGGFGGGFSGGGGGGFGGGRRRRTLIIHGNIYNYRYC